MTEKSTRRGHRFALPHAPEHQAGAVKVWEEPVVFRTYLPETPERNPMFLEKRVYQGSSGRVYPLPYIDRIATEPVDKEWQAIHIENEYLRLMILPEIGGRIHVGYDKTNGYDFFYRQNVIKPALVGLAGPWISGGVEFNWPQHHRPATFMPVTTEIERHEDGSVTVWCSDYDRLSGMKGMHGVCLHPGKAIIELKVRLYNGTPFTRTFLWWANMATRVHEHYQSFFPPDVRFVADHAKRAISTFPLAKGIYYGIDYGQRARSGVKKDELPAQFVQDGTYPPNDLSWFSNIPVPTSYMVVGTEANFFGGYDHAANAGVVHVADRHIAPGKKQWTWGNHDFGYAWDRSLTDDDGPYVELMAGVYTDNQPDFSFLAPGETRTFCQYWYPIRKIGPPVAANTCAALALEIKNDRISVGVDVTENISAATLEITAHGKRIGVWSGELTVKQPLFLSFDLPKQTTESDLRTVIRTRDHDLLSYQPSFVTDSSPPETASEPPLPGKILTCEELYLTGLHLQQYRHATRVPEIYWQEALRRDPGDMRSNNALGLWHLERCEFARAEQCFRRAIARATQRNPNPRDGEPYYNLGLSLIYQGRNDEAYDAFFKATWNAAFRSAAYHELCKLDVARGDWPSALSYMDIALRMDTDNLHLRNLWVVGLRALGRHDEAETFLRTTRKLDPLDAWSRYLEDKHSLPTGHHALQLAFDLISAFQLDDAFVVLNSIDKEDFTPNGTRPMALYTLAWCHARRGEHEQSVACYTQAQIVSQAYCFPNRLEEFIVLEAAIAANPLDARARYYLGNLLYDKRRHEEAIALWERSSEIDPANATVWRNLGVAYFNIRKDVDRARTSFDKALSLNPTDARILFERDQLWKRIGVPPSDRLAELLKYPSLVACRDDLSVEFATLHNRVNDPQAALQVLLSRHFQPWEGGEGLTLEQYVEAYLALGRMALRSGRKKEAQRYFMAALEAPHNLGEAKHLLVNQSQIYYLLGEAFAGMDDSVSRKWYERAAQQRGDFQSMSVQPVSEATYWSALAMKQLGHEEEARKLLSSIDSYARELEQQEPTIDYFATSLPAMLLFEEDIAKRNRTTALFLRAQAEFGLRTGKSDLLKAQSLVEEVLNQNGNHLGALQLWNEINSALQKPGEA